MGHKKLKCPGILLSLDFQKAFDNLERSSIHNVLKIYNFGESLRNWIKVCYTDIESTVLKNGYATNWIKPSTGVRQACPLSLYLFILTAEIMSTKIRQSGDVKGISIFGKEIKVSQFADDTNLLCKDKPPLHVFFHIEAMQFRLSHSKPVNCRNRA